MTHAGDEILPFKYTAVTARGVVPLDALKAVNPFDESNFLVGLQGIRPADAGQS